MVGRRCVVSAEMHVRRDGQHGADVCGGGGDGVIVWVLKGRPQSRAHLC